MNLMFLQSSSLMGTGSSSVVSALTAGALAILVGYMLFYWIFMSLAFMAIAKKDRQKNPEIAWIPFLGPRIIAYKSSEMHWWPWLLIIGFFIPIINFFAPIIFAVYIVVWNWRLFENVGKPGWWSILMLVPILNYVFAGIVAWSD